MTDTENIFRGFFLGASALAIIIFIIIYSWWILLGAVLGFIFGALLVME